MTKHSTLPAPNFDLNHRRVIITGAARGLGADLAAALVASGARVVLTDVLHERGQALATQLGEQAHYLGMDMSSPDAITQGMTQAVQWLGGLDGLVNNAAITNSGGKAMEAISIATWDAVQAVNVRGVWLASCAAVPHLALSAHPRIVNIASDTALWGAPNLMAYVASKGAVIAMTRAMARELGAQSITVNAIAPGLTEVEATAYVPQARHDLYRDGRALKRPQVPSDVTASILFLLSPGSSYITGQVLPVNAALS